MKVAIIFAAGGSAVRDAILAPYRSSGFVAGLEGRGIAPVAIWVTSGEDDVPTGGLDPPHLQPQSIRCGVAGLGAVLAAERPDMIQTFGPERQLAPIWPVAAGAGVPVVHCVSAWRDETPDRDIAEAAPLPRLIASLPLSRARRASRYVDALIGTSRVAVGSLVTGGYFSHAAFSVIVPPPVEQGAAPVAPPVGGTAPVFGIYDPGATSSTLAFISHAIALTGGGNGFVTRVALRRRPPDAATASLAVVAAEGIERFLPAIDILAVPVFDDTAVVPLIAALRSRRSVIVPDRGGAAELIEYGRHGIMFAAGSAYHFANALNLVAQSWSETPVLRREGGPAITRTEPATVAAAFAGVYEGLLASRRPGASPALSKATASS